MAGEPAADAGGGAGAPSRSARRAGAAAILAALLVGNGLLLDVALRELAPHSHRHNSLTHLQRLLTGDIGGDSWMPMRRALAAAQRPEDGDLYRQVFFEQGVKFQYPPSSLRPVAALERARIGAGGLGRGRNRLLNEVTLVCYLATAAATAALLDLRLRREARRTGRALGRTERALAAVAAAAGTALFYPLLKGVTLGQIQPWIDASVAVALLAAAARLEAGAGAALGFAVWLKPQLGVLLVWAALRRRWRFAAAFAATALAGAVWATARFGFANQVEYLRFLGFLARHGESYHPNQSLNGLLHRLAGIGRPEIPNVDWGDGLFPPAVPWIAWASLAGSILILVLAFRPGRRSIGDPVADLGAAVLAATMASPIAWEHHYGILPPLFALLFARWWGDPRAVPGGWLLAAFLLASHYAGVTLRLADTPLNPLESYLYAAAWIGLVLLLRCRPGEDPAAATARAEPGPDAGLALSASRSAP